MSSIRLSEYLDHQALVAKLADVSEQCYKLLQLCNDLEKNLNDHNTDPEAHLDIRKAIEVVSGRLDTANTAFNAHISNIKNTYDAEVAELKKKDTDLENNLGEVSDKLDTVEKGEHVYDNSIKSEVVADDILAAAKGNAIIQSTTDKDGVVMLASLESPSGIYTLGSNHDEFEVNFHSDSDLAKNSPAATQSVVLLDKNGNSKFGKNVSAEQFTGSLVGNVTGNADTASDASRFNGLVTTDFIRTTGNVNQTVTGTKTFSSPIVGNLQGTAGNADKLDNLDSSDFVRKTNNVAETITGNKTFSATVYGDSFQPKSGNKTGTIGTSDNGYKTIYVEHVEASTIAGNVTGNLTGNADTATKLRTPRKINDTDFDGTTAITTQIWGTTRNFYIADSTGKHTGIPIGVNGSGTVTLRLPPKIDAETTGNASTATKLATAKKINGTNFDGTHDITTAYWGTRRNVYISDSDGTHTGIAVTMDGSGNVTLRLPSVIKADLIGSTTGIASNAENTVLFNGLTTGDFVRTTGNVNQTVTGTKTFNSPINSPVTTGNWINGNRGVAIINSTANAGYNVLFRMKSSHGVFTGCAWNQSYQINYTTDSIVNAGTNATTYTNTLIDENGNATFSNNITVRGTVNGNLTGNVTGNASTATNATYANWLRTSSHTDHLFHTEWDNAGYFWTYVTAGNGEYRAVRVARSDRSGNADTATKLATARSLWGNNFDGSAAITGAITGTPSIEFKPAATTSNNGGYLDFHYNQSTADYTSRIIESASGTLSINNVTITTGKVVTATTFNGALTGNVTGNCSGSSGSCTGNAATATKADTATNANHAKSADTATNATNANYASRSTNNGGFYINNYLVTIG